MYVSLIAGTGGNQSVAVNVETSRKPDFSESVCPERMLKKPVQKGRSERDPEAYGCRYVKGLSDARTQVAGFFSIR